MLHHYLQPIVTSLHAHPEWGSFIAFTMAFIESLAVIGTVVPGSVTMTAIGALIGTGVLPAGPTIGWAIAGAYSGDCLSYWVGRHYQDRIRRMWPFVKYPQWLARGEAFFKAHGGKSVIIGRFTGPVRSVVPLIAGLLNMRPLRFLPVGFISAVMWAILYMLPGILLGALTSELPPSVATKFILICLGIIAIVWGITWVIKFTLDQTWNGINLSLIKLWNYLNTHKESHWITRMLRNPQHDEDHLQLVYAIFLIICIILFTIVTLSVVNKGWIISYNHAVYSLLQSIHVRVLDDIMVGFTIIGDKRVLLPAAGLLFIYMLASRRWWEATHWLLLMAGAAASIELFRKIIHSPRPPLGALADTTYSYPSGHAVLSLVFYGFLASLLSNQLKTEDEARPFWIAGILIVIISFTRIYLGAHWLSDIVGSLLLGFIWTLFITLSYRRRTPKPQSPKKLSIIIIALVAILGFAYSYNNFRSLRGSYTANWPITSLSSEQWWTQEPGSVPIYISNRLGKPNEPLNLQWAAPIAQIQETLTQQGWINRPPKINLNATVSRLSNKQAENLPILPLLYHGHSPTLIMTKKLVTQENTIILLRLWRSDIAFSDSASPLWIGIINYYTPTVHLITLHKNNEPEFQDAMTALIPNLKNFSWKIIIMDPMLQPEAIRKQNWDGQILLVKTQYFPN